MSHKRPRQLASVVILAAAGLALAACGGQYPNSTFTYNTDLNTAVYGLWNRLLLLGTIVFVFVEGLLLYTIWRYRRQEGAPAPKQTHGNATLEIAWTAIPALILALIAVPTVQVIWKTQGPAPAGALEVEVIGHQWWWEFRYPQYGVVTANELYLPAGRSANFKLMTRDVLHSFWTPQLGGKRDLITNHTNLLWYTPKADLAENVWNGFCTEYCGSSHANMRLRVYTVSAEKFESWALHQKSVAMMSTPPAPAATAALAKAAGRPAVAQASLVPVAVAPAAPEPSGGYVFPADKLPSHAIPQTPFPDIAFDDEIGRASCRERVYSSV